MSFNLCDDEAMDTSSPRRSTGDDDTTFVDEYNAWRQTDRQSIKLRGVSISLYLKIVIIMCHHICTQNSKRCKIIFLIFGC